MFNRKTITTLVRFGALLLFSILALATAPTLHAGNIAMQDTKTNPAHIAPSKAANRIILSDYEGSVFADEEAVWMHPIVKGNAPGDFVPYRFTVEANGPASGQFQVRFSGDTKKCLAFDNVFIFNAIGYISGKLPNVTLAGNPTTEDFAVPENFGTPRAEWVVTFNISFEDAGKSQIYHFLKLSDQTGTCRSVPPHSRLKPSAGDVDTRGIEWLFIPSK